MRTWRSGDDLRTQSPGSMAMRRAHPELQRAKWMLDGLTAYAHHVRLLVKPLLHRFNDGLMLPALYAASLFA